MRFTPALCLGAAFAALASSPLAAAPIRDYADCLALLDRDPGAAREAAGEWRRFGGGAPAGICEALALSALGARAGAALRLDALAGDGLAGLGPEQRVEARSLAADLWLAEDLPDRALKSLAAALDIAPGDPALLGVRAQAHAAKGDWDAAIADLNVAIARAPRAAGLHLLRAEGRRGRGDFAGALQDAEAAIAQVSGSPRAWLEKGRAEAGLKRRDAARESLLRAVALDRDGLDAQAARRALQRLDGG